MIRSTWCPILNLDTTSLDNMTRVLHHVDDSTPIWRYMDFDKFAISLFPTSMRFASFKSMSDHTEGRWYRYPGATEPYIYGEVANRTFVMCWTLNDPSSTQPWKAYTTPSKGIVLQTTFGKLRQEYHSNRAGPIMMFVEQVRYTDNPITVTPSPDLATTSKDILDIATTKSSSFAWEKEVRAIAVQTNEDAPWDCVLGSMETFDLIDDISICPDAEPWLQDTLDRVLKHRVTVRNHMYASVLRPQQPDM